MNVNVKEARKGEGDGDLYELSPITSYQTARDFPIRHLSHGSMSQELKQTGILYEPLQLMFFTRNIKSFTKIQNTTKRLPNRYFNTKTTLKMPLVVPGIKFI